MVFISIIVFYYRIIKAIIIPNNININVSVDFMSPSASTINISSNGGFSIFGIISWDVILKLFILLSIYLRMISRSLSFDG